MSSWFGSGFSQLTGQISNFTKEVLEEGTEEIDDHATQLKIAKQHLVELNSHCHSQRSELERLQTVNDELQEKLESSELQINAISNEYREIVERKEEEVKKLRNEQTALQSSRALVDVAPSSSPPGASLPHSSSAPSLNKGFFGDDQDFDDVISTQYEINHLRSENQRMDSECRHWKQVAQANQTIPGRPGEEAEEIYTVRTQLQELREQYDSEIDQHQRELAALQDVQQQKLSTLKKKHKEEVAELKQGATAAQGVNSVDKQLQDKLSHLESVNNKVSVDLDLTHAADREKARRLQELQQQHNSLQTTHKQLSQEQKEQEEENSALMEQLDSVVSENRSLKNQVADLHHKVKKNHEAERLQTSDQRGASPASDDTTRLQTLQNQVTGYQREIDQFDLVKSDWLMEKEALEDVLLRLREQLRDQEELAEQSVKDHTNSDGNSIVENEGLNKKIEMLTANKEELEKERNQLQLEKDQLQKQLGHRKQSLLEPQLHQNSEVELNVLTRELQEQLTEKQQQLQALVREREDADDLAAQVDDLQENLKSTEDDNNNLRLELDDTKAELDTITSKHISLIKEYDNLKHKVSTLTDERNKFAAEAQSRSQKQQIKQQEKEALIQENERLTGELNSLVESLEELDSQHQAAMSQMIHSKNNLSHEVDDLKKQLHQSLTKKDNHDSQELVEELQQEIHQLKTERQKVGISLNDLHMANQELLNAKAKLKEEKKTLSNKVHEITKERNHLQKLLDDSETASTLREEELWEAKDAVLKARSGQKEVDNLRSQLEQLQAENQQLKKSISNLESQFQQQTEEDTLSKGSNEETAHSLGRNTTSNDAASSSSAENQKHINDLISEKDHAVSSLSSANDRLSKENKTQADSIMGLEVEVKRLIIIEKLHQECSKDSNPEQIKEETQSKNSHLSNQEAQSQLETFRTTVHELEDRLSIHEEEITDLKKEKEGLIKTISDKNAVLEELQNQGLVNNHESVQETPTIVSNRKRLKVDGNISDQTVMQNGDINGDNDENDGHSLALSDEVRNLKKLISQKDNVIIQLNDNNSSLLNLLEERSQAVYGDRTLVDIHMLESKVQSLSMEKDQMMSVLNDKTRECSSLKGEVHRLMNVISAEKVALSKLQQDNQILMKNKETVSESPNEDMSLEAIKKLSQMVRHKEMEIEALNQKNQTLLQVLQESSQGGQSDISTLLQEKENLMKQVAIFQQDREQVIAALQAKHQESLAYHEEVQRLSQIVTMEMQNKDQLHNEFASLKQQYEDKQETLIKTHDEMLKYKRKHAELDSRMRDLQSKKWENLESNHSGRSTPQQLLTSEDPKEIDPDSPEVQQLLEEIQQLKDVIRNNDATSLEKDKSLQGKAEELQKKDHSLLEKTTQLSDKDKQISELNSRIHRSEESIHIKDLELSSLKKQSDNIAFQLHGIQLELSDLRQERDQLYERSSVLHQELGAMKDANNKLTMVINDKDFEVKSLKEKNDNINKLLQQDGGEATEKGELDRLLGEMEGMQQQSQGLKQERDRALLALQQQQTETQQLRNEIARLREKQQKLVKELDRLRAHLLSIEDNYTQDALAAEEREKELRNRLAVAEDMAMSSTSAVQAANQHALMQVENLQVQLHTLAEQRDNAILKLSSAQDTANQYSTSLHNLQMVLEQFQMEKETQQNTELERIQKEATAYKNELIQTRDQVRQLQIQVEETTDALEAAQRLSEQLDRKEEMISALREEVNMREAELMKTETELHKLNSSSEAKVDKVLIKSLIVGYFHTQSNQRQEALRLICSMLEFTHDEMQELSGKKPGSGWLGGLFRKSSPTPPATPKAKMNQSFSELFVNFLERESSPKPEMRLPMDRMVAEAQMKHSHHTPPAGAAFNPFSAPMHASAPLHVSVDQNSSLSNPYSHPLMKPITPSLPVFTPASPSQNSNLLMMSTSTPISSNSGSILRDVLQQ